MEPILIVKTKIKIGLSMLLGLKFRNQMRVKVCFWTSFELALVLTGKIHSHPFLCHASQCFSWPCILFNHSHLDDVPM